MEGLGHRIRHWLLAAGRGIRRLRALRSRPTDARYRSPSEIALANAADTLGVELGSDYLDGLDPEELSADVAGQAAPDRVSAFREELVAYIDARNRRRRRLRASKIVAVSLSLALAVALANELARFPSSDEPRRGPAPGSVLDHPLLSSRHDLPPSMRRGVGVPRGGSRVTTEMPAAGGDKYIHSGYMDLNEDICVNTAQVNRMGVMRSEGGGGCTSPREMARVMGRAPVFVMGIQGGRDHVLLSGFGRADLERIVPRDSRVSIDSAITGVWHPRGNASDDFAIRAFLLRVWQGTGVRLGGNAMSVNRRDMDLVGVFADGARVPVTGYLEALQGERPPTEIVDRVFEPIR